MEKAMILVNRKNGRRRGRRRPRGRSDGPDDHEDEDDGDRSIRRLVMKAVANSEPKSDLPDAPYTHPRRDRNTGWKPMLQLTPSRRHSRCTAIAPGMALGDRSQPAEANPFDVSHEPRLQHFVYFMSTIPPSAARFHGRVDRILASST